MWKKHFIGELVDEEKSIRFVGFDPAQCMRLDAFINNKQPVLLKNCNTQLNSYSNTLEVVVKGYTKISESSRNFNIDDPTKIGTTPITLDQLSDINEFSKVNVNAKVIDISQ